MSDPVLLAVVVEMTESEWNDYKIETTFEKGNDYHAHWGQTPKKGDSPSWIGYGYEHMGSDGFGQDGDYQSESSIPEHGTEAIDGGFLFQVAPFCPWGAYSFGGFTVPISNGKFSFFVFDYQNREFIVKLWDKKTGSELMTQDFPWRVFGCWADCRANWAEFGSHLAS